MLKSIAKTTVDSVFKQDKCQACKLRIYRHFIKKGNGSMYGQEFPAPHDPNRRSCINLSKASQNPKEHQLSSVECSQQAERRLYRAKSLH